MTGQFPRGVADGQGVRAVVHDRRGTLVALDPRTGRVAWRAGHGLRPCALVAATVVAVRIDAPGEPGVPLVVVLLDADDGVQRWASAPLALPPWARPALYDTDAFTLDAESGDDQVVLRWTARSGYRGGAAPGPDRLAAASHEARGAVRVDLRGPPSVTPLPEPPPAPETEEAPPSAVRVGDLTVELAVRPAPSGAAVVLRGTRPPADAPVWELVLDEAPPPRAPPLRP
ncbi:hypothetical protein RKD49_006666 [Streptomyces glaucescens]